jgi:hypothetical protein
VWKGNLLTNEWGYHQNMWILLGQHLIPFRLIGTPVLKGVSAHCMLLVTRDACSHFLYRWRFIPRNIAAGCSLVFTIVLNSCQLMTGYRSSLPCIPWNSFVLSRECAKTWGEHGQSEVGVSRHLFVLNCGPTGSKALKNLILAGTISYTAVEGCLSSRCCCRWFASCTYPRPVFNLNGRVVEYSKF